MSDNIGYTPGSGANVDSSITMANAETFTVDFNGAAITLS
jgi:hypothetical protein